MSASSIRAIYTRSSHSLNYVQTQREKYLKMTISEKRKLYSCRSKYLTVDKIPNWLAYGKENKLETRNSSSKRNEFKFDPKLSSKISVWIGDITRLEIDAIVNAANGSLLGGGGVDGAIHSAAGDLLVQECRTLHGCETGKAKITAGYNLPARYVIHTVGPIGENATALESCYKTSLELAVENKCRTIAFPCVSTGIYGYPNLNAAHVALTTVRTFLESSHENFDRIIFCLFLPKDVKIYEDLLPHYFPLESNSNEKDDKPEDEVDAKGKCSKDEEKGNVEKGKDDGTQMKSETLQPNDVKCQDKSNEVQENSEKPIADDVKSENKVDEIKEEKNEIVVDKEETKAKTKICNEEITHEQEELDESKNVKMLKTCDPLEKIEPTTENAIVKNEPIDQINKNIAEETEQKEELKREAVAQ